MTGLTIVSTGSSLPARSITNEEYAGTLETDDEWIFRRTGIHSRYICSGQESAFTLARNAAAQALERSGLKGSEIGAVVCATLSSGYSTPALACLIQRDLGLPENIPAFDLNAACSGFLYAMETARGFLHAAGRKYALVIGSEQLSGILDFTDRSTCVLFGDGAGAAVVAAEPESIYCSCFGSRGGTAILAPGPSAARIRNNRKETDTPDPGIPPVNEYLTMDGREVFCFACDIIPSTADQLLHRSGKTMEDLDWIVCHQANARIIDHCIRKMKADPAKFYKCMDHFGNTSSASIPLALSEMTEKGLLREGQQLMLLGFGAGLSWAGIMITYGGIPQKRGSNENAQ